MKHSDLPDAVGVTTQMSSPRAKRGERLRLVRVEHLDALRVQGPHEALIQPLRKRRCLCGALGKDAVGDDRIADLLVGQQALERLDGAGRLIQAHPVSLLLDQTFCLTRGA